jgi:hypothetical protein
MKKEACITGARLETSEATLMHFMSRVECVTHPRMSREPWGFVLVLLGVIQRQSTGEGG